MMERGQDMKNKPIKFSKAELLDMDIFHDLQQKQTQQAINAISCQRQQSNIDETCISTLEELVARGYECTAQNFWQVIVNETFSACGATTIPSNN
jgi:hypothetical protein